MPRILIVLLLLSSLLLTGCADLMKLFPSDGDMTSAVQIYVAPTPQPFPPEVSTAARIRERGKLLVGVRYDLEPFSYVAADGMLAGLEVELARELARRWLGDPGAVQFQQVRSDTAQQHLLDGEVDFVLAGIVHTQGAENEADYSLPYFMDGEALLTYPDTGVLGPAQVGGHNVGGLDWAAGLEKLAISAPEEFTAAPYGDYFQLVEALRTRQVDVYADRRLRLERARRMVAGTQILGQYTYEPVALMYRENDPYFAELVTATFRDMAADGTWESLYVQWFSSATLPTLPSWSTKPTPQGTGTRPTPTLAGAPRERSNVDTVSGIRNRGVVEVGYFIDRWPYSADRDDGVPTGFEVWLLERMVERWLGTRQAVTFIPVTAEDDALARLENGELDLLIGGWVHTSEAEVQVGFTHTLLDDGVSILSPETAPVESLAALAGQAVGVIQGTAGAAALPAISQQIGIAFSPNTYPDLDTAVAALQGGAVAVLLAERRLLLDPFYRVGGFHLTDERLTARPVAYVLPRGDSDFRDLLNLTLSSMYANGSFDELYRVWFDDPIPEPILWPGEPLIPLTLRAME
ncbi:MAG: transporter substrate-binding domain-containing protein [Anaerolineae bacterium]|nr:transporter substrate-binding domain-containing protein [Anaerolineae bacterium]